MKSKNRQIWKVALNVMYLELKPSSGHFEVDRGHFEVKS